MAEKMTRDEAEVLAKATKLIEALAESCDVDEDADHEWRKCRRCLAHHEASLKHSRVLFCAVLTALLEGEQDSEFYDVVFDGPPSHESGRFVEVEDGHGRSIRAGKWTQRVRGA